MVIESNKDELKAKRATERLRKRQQLVEAFSEKGNYRAATFAAVLGCGESTLWKKVADKKIAAPMKFGSRTSVWSGKYIASVRDGNQEVM